MCTLCIVSKKWPCVHSVAALVRLLLQEEGTAYLQRQGWETEKATVLRLLSIYSVSLWDTFLMGKNFFYFFPQKRDSIFTGCPDKFVICMRKAMYWWSEIFASEASYIYKKNVFLLQIVAFWAFFSNCKMKMAF